jgi:hypothetical protein
VKIDSQRNLRAIGLLKKKGRTVEEGGRVARRPHRRAVDRGRSQEARGVGEVAGAG